MILYHEIEKVDYELNEDEEITILDFGIYEIVLGKRDTIYYLRPKDVVEPFLFIEGSDFFNFSEPKINSDIHLFETEFFRKGILFCFMRLKKHLKEKKLLSKEEDNLLLLMYFLLSNISDAKNFLIIEIDENNYVILKDKPNEIQYIYHLDFNIKGKSFISYENMVKNKFLNKENIFNFLSKKENHFNISLILQIL